MEVYPESELVLNADGSVYHLNLLPEHIADTIIVVGDPDRVHKVSRHFDSVDFKSNKREFITHTGTLNKKTFTVISTGIGTDNVEIVLQELDALVNIDLKTRTLKSHHHTLNIIRIGTSGSVREEVPIGSMIVSKSAVGLDSLMQFYELPQGAKVQHICNAIKEKLSLRFLPYLAYGNDTLFNRFSSQMILGNTLTCPGFYAPQGRQLRAKSVNDKLLTQINRFEEEDYRLTNLEMETAGYYAFGEILGHKVISLNVILANRITNSFSKKPEKEIDKLIEIALSLV